MVDHEDDQISNRDERNETCVLERIQPSQEAQGNYNQHKSRDPKMPVNQEGRRIGVGVEPPHDTRHQVANDNQVRNTDSEAFHCNGSIEYNGGIGVGKLG